MDDLFQILFEGILEVMAEFSRDKQVPRFIRYVLIGIIVLLFAAVFGGVLFGTLVSWGMIPLDESFYFGIVLIELALFVLVVGIVKLRRNKK